MIFGDQDKQSKFFKNRNASFRHLSSADVLDGPGSSPAFLCERVFIQIDVKKVTDIGGNNKVKLTLGSSTRALNFPILQENKQIPLPLYMSRAQLKRRWSRWTTHCGTDNCEKKPIQLCKAVLCHRTARLSTQFGFRDKDG